MGALAAGEHEGLAPAILAAAPDRVFLIGPEMSRLKGLLPAAMVAGAFTDSASAAPVIAGQMCDGDLVTVKGSLGMRMAAVVAALNGLSLHRAEAC